MKLVKYVMREELAVDMLYNDFISRVTLTDNEKEILPKYINGDSYVKMAIDTAQSYSSVSRTIVDLKRKYEIYKKMELTKLTLFNRNK